MRALHTNYEAVNRNRCVSFARSEIRDARSPLDESAEVGEGGMILVDGPQIGRAHV